MTLVTTDPERKEAPMGRTLAMGRRGPIAAWMRNKRYDVALPYLCSPLLEVGFGAEAVLAKRFSADCYVGVETCEASRVAAKAAHPHHRFIAPGGLGDEKFPNVAAVAVLEYVDDPQGFVDELTRHVLPGGYVVITTTVARSHSKQEQRTLFSKGDMLELLAKAGLELVSHKKFMMGTSQLVVGLRTASAS